MRDRLYGHNQIQRLSVHDTFGPSGRMGNSFLLIASDEEHESVL